MANPWELDEEVSANPWDADEEVSNPLAKPAPRQDTYKLFQQAQAGDPAAREAYNQRAQTYGQNTLEQDAEQNSPVAGQNFAQNAWQSAGRYWPNLARNFDSPEEVERARQADAPLLQTWGGLTGNIASNTAMLLAPQSKLTAGLSVAGKAAPYLSAGIVGGAAGAAEPVGQGESRAGNAGRAALWGVGGQGAGDIVGAGAKFLTPSMTKETSDILDTAYSMGVRPDAGQVSKNPLTKQVFNQLGRMPLSGQGGRAEANQIAFNRVVSEAYGVPADKITSEVHSKAVNALSGQFERLKAATQIPVAPSFLTTVKTARNQVRDKFGAEAAKSYDFWAQNLLNRSKNGVISGPDYQAWSSELSEDLGKMSGDRKAGAGELAKFIEKSAADGLSPADKKAWTKVRQQWAVMKQVEPLVAKNGGTGDIPPAQLLGAVTRDEAGKVRLARGKGGTLADAARVGQQFLKEPADSGTAGRSGVINAFQRVIQNPAAQTAGLAGGAYAADKYGLATPGQLGGLAGLLLLNRAGLKTAAAPSVIRGAPQRIIASSAKKVLPRVAVPYALSQSAAAEEKKKPKRP
jgi:hypothetical protein